MYHFVTSADWREISQFEKKWYPKWDTKWVLGSWLMYELDASGANSLRSNYIWSRLYYIRSRVLYMTNYIRSYGTLCRPSAN